MSVFQLVNDGEGIYTVITFLRNNNFMPGQAKSLEFLKIM